MSALPSRPTPLSQDPWWKVGGKWLGYWSVITTCRIVLALVSRVRVVSPEKLPPGPYLIACNHISHFDPPVTSIVTGRKMDYMAMRDLLQHPAVSWLLGDVCDVFAVSRDRIDTGAVRTAVRRLRDGRIVILFPEGGIRSGATSVLGGAPMPPGAATLAQMAGVPIRPMILLGCDQLYQWRSLWKRPVILVGWGHGLEVDPSLEAAAAREDLNERLRQSWLVLHAEMKNHPDYHPGLEPRTAQERWSERA